jgi:hypothetical protein
MGPASENAGYGDDDARPAPLNVPSMGPASENAGYASMSFLAISQRLEGAAARGCLHAASVCGNRTSDIFITPFLQMRWGLRERSRGNNRDNFKLSKTVASN